MLQLLLRLLLLLLLACCLPVAGCCVAAADMLLLLHLLLLLLLLLLLSPTCGPLALPCQGATILLFVVTLRRGKGVPVKAPHRFGTLHSSPAAGCCVAAADMLLLLHLLLLLLLMLLLLLSYSWPAGTTLPGSNSSWSPCVEARVFM